MSGWSKPPTSAAGRSASAAGRGCGARAAGDSGAAGQRLSGSPSVKIVAYTSGSQRHPYRRPAHLQVQRSAAASTASRIASPSNRFRFIRQSSRLSGSIRCGLRIRVSSGRCGLRIAGPAGGLAVGVGGDQEVVEGLEAQAVGGLGVRPAPGHLPSRAPRLPPGELQASQSRSSGWVGGLPARRSRWAWRPGRGRSGAARGGSPARGR